MRRSHRSRSSDRSFAWFSRLMLLPVAVLVIMRMAPAVQANWFGLDVLQALPWTEMPQDSLAFFRYEVVCADELRGALHGQPAGDPALRPYMSVLCGWVEEEDFAGTDTRAALAAWQMGRMSYLQGRTDEALQIWRSVAGADSYLAKLGADLYWRNRDETGTAAREEALRFLLLAEQINPEVTAEKAASYEVLYRIYRAPPLRDQEAALRYAQKLLQVEPSVANYAAVANLQLALEAFAPALGTLQAMQEAFPQADETYYPLGRAYRGLGDLPAALDALERAPRNSDNYPLVQVEMAAILLERGDKEEARQLAQAAAASSHERAARLARALLADLEKK